MADIKPFKALRPVADKIHLVATRSVDNYPKEDLSHKLYSNPYSFLHVINPDFADGKRTKPGSVERLKKIKNRFLDFVKEEVFMKDQKPSYYLYQQFKDGNIYTGIIGCSSVADYDKGVIKVHEHTLPEREEKLKQYLEICDYNAEPVLFCYENIAAIDDVINLTLLKHPAYDYSTTDRVRHKLWVISDKKTVELIRSEFGKLNAVYIADGHHRSASSSKLAHERAANNPNPTGKENYNYYLGIFFPEDQLRIFDFNRIVTDTNGLSTEEFLSKLKESFKIVHHKENSYKPEQTHKFSMYLDGNWYELIAKPFVINTKDPVKRLDASILSDHILGPLLGIKDIRSDKRISFVPGIKGMQELKRMVDIGKFKLAFGLFPVRMPELKNIADNNLIMPPKTTWVEPKMRSGLVVYSLEED
ncbi:MAG: DUF1015 domain-containing protein [Bacteroidia bacterium]|nr:DUF1015 domain-containing protein [Bacteroidia bacterium]